MNYGFIAEEPTPLDWQFGSEKQIGFEVINPIADWTKYLVDYEYQNLNFETMACVSFSALNCLEILFLKKYGYPPNWSDRFTSKMSGTTKSGNSMRNVAESIRKENGFIGQELWKNEGKTWDDWYASIPENIQRQALSNLDKYTINYEWIRPDKEEMKSALRCSPIQIAIYAYGDKVDGVYQRIEGYMPNHCVTLFKIDDKGQYWIFDHYIGNEVRILASDYIIGYAMRFNILKGTQPKDMKFLKEKNSPHIYLIAGDKKIMVVDMPTLDALNEDFAEVDSLDSYADGGSLLWVDRIIN